MTITATMVKELRERTGAGMMACKKALQEASGDIETAIADMRKAGQANAAKKSGRIAAEGMIAIQITDDKLSAAMLEVNCETDFVGRDESFVAFVNAVTNTALTQASDDVDALSKVVLQNTDKTVEESRQALVGQLGENIQVRRVFLLSAKGVLGSYRHGHRIGVLVALDNGDQTLAKDIAMHIAASQPIVISSDDVSQELLDKEKDIYMAQAAESGKPPEIVEKMVGGRLKKYVNEISLLGQPFVKDPSQTIADLLKTANATVSGFMRFEVGEGIEKKTDNFAEEVMAQVQGSD